MGLDAFVYCDCYEKGRLREPPPSGVLLRVEPDGWLGPEHDDGTLESGLAWDRWREQRACEHVSGILLHHRLGNIALVGLLRAELRRETDHFPILTAKVIYSGSHTGDFLAVETIPALQRELELLREFQCTTRESADFMSEFREQMSELATVALSVGKPISFG
jgi:hypothetical protein